MICIVYKYIIQCCDFSAITSKITG